MSGCSAKTEPIPQVPKHSTPFYQKLCGYVVVESTTETLHPQNIIFLHTHSSSYNVRLTSVFNSIRIWTSSKIYYNFTEFSSHCRVVLFGIKQKFSKLTPIIYSKLINVKSHKRCVYYMAFLKFLVHFLESVVAGSRTKMAWHVVLLRSTKGNSICG